MIVTTPDPLFKVKSLTPSIGSESTTWPASPPRSSSEKYCFLISTSSFALVAGFPSACDPAFSGIKYPTVLKSSKKYLLTISLIDSVVTELTRSSYRVYSVQSPEAIASFKLPATAILPSCPNFIAAISCAFALETSSSDTPSLLMFSYSATKASSTVLCSTPGAKFAYTANNPGSLNKESQIKIFVVSPLSVIFL